MSGGGRRRKAHEEEHVNHERWLVSYSDMITVLMGLFIVLFAMSQVDQEKYEALRASLQAGFQVASGSDGILDGSSGVMDGHDAPDTPRDPATSTAGIVDADEGLGLQGADLTSHERLGTDPRALALAEEEAEHLEQIRDRIRAELESAHLARTVDFRIDDRGLTMRLVADDVFFAASSAELTETARQVLDTASATLREISEHVSVEGHANIIPVSGRYPTNWELSSDRATQVLRRLVENGGVPGERVMAVGFGDERPLVSGTDDMALAANRRVDLVVLSDAPEAVRDLLPVVDQEKG
ncbi:flagellar motor protein MotB [Xylanimonas oleitrophica]|uniref:Flagellar motor protein MotB n=1 Tax=Xylanimonas oleitrophica TaxID=2607479 RepID=A0A2W5X1I3_9MICO|nr:flagellar motor protein MotB [Xylanimonas oleitrophica]PZR54135.1 flagellar motor protein MotB [Xylanimonas oleitrophica]